MLITLLQVLHVFVCAVLMFVVLLQQGKGGGMGAALGGGGAAQVFGGRGAGNLLTRATGVAATTFMLTSVGLAYMSSSGDRALKARAADAEHHHATKAATAPAAPPSATPATPSTPSTGAPAPSSAPSP